MDINGIPDSLIHFSKEMEQQILLENKLLIFLMNINNLIYWNISLYGPYSFDAWLIDKSYLGKLFRKVIL